MKKSYILQDTIKLFIEEKSPGVNIYMFNIFHEFANIFTYMGVEFYVYPGWNFLFAKSDIIIRRSDLLQRYSTRHKGQLLGKRAYVIIYKLIHICNDALSRNVL